MPELIPQEADPVQVDQRLDRRAGHGPGQFPVETALVRIPGLGKPFAVPTQATGAQGHGPG